MLFRRKTACVFMLTVCLLIAACVPVADVKTDSIVTTTATTTAVTTTTTTTATVPTTTTAKATTTATKNVAAPTTQVSVTLDPTYSRLLLVNADNPLPSDYDSTGNLTTVDKRYINGSLNQVDKGIHPYLMAI